MKLSKKTIQGLLSLFLILGLLGIQACSTIFPLMAPFSDLPSPSGPFAVGTTQVCWTDSSRDELFTPAADFRRLAVQVWYPQTGPAGLSPYIDHPALRIPALTKQLRLPRSMIQHIGQVSCNSTIDGPLTSSPGYPVLIFSHGLSGMRYQNTALMEDLASHGYVVIAPDHSYDANIAIFDDGSYAEYRAGKKRVLKGDYLAYLDLEQLSYRVGDIRFIMDQIERGLTLEALGDVPVDLDKVGLLGHSLGGTTILAALVGDPRFKAALVLDGWYTPLPDTVMSQGLDRPVLHIGQTSWSDKSNYIHMDDLFSVSTAPLFKVLVPGTQHTDFTDMPLFSPISRLIGFTGTDDPIALLELMGNTSVHFFDTTLRDQSVEAWLTYLDNLSGVQTYAFFPQK